MSIAFRHSAGFGRRMEYWLIGQMLREGLDVYVPLVDDFGIDAVIRKRDNQFIEIQIKARSRTVLLGDTALFAAIDHPEPRRSYYFVPFGAARGHVDHVVGTIHQEPPRTSPAKCWQTINQVQWYEGGRYPVERYKQYQAEDFSIFRESLGW